jgi:hypothetical protein
MNSDDEESWRIFAEPVLSSTRFFGSESIENGKRPLNYPETKAVI